MVNQIKNVIQNNMQNPPLLVNNEWTIDAKTYEDWYNWLYEDIQTYDAIQWEDLLIWACTGGKLAAIKEAKEAKDNALFSNTVQSAAYAAEALLESRQPLYINKPGRQEIIAILVQANIITSNDAAELIALSLVTVKRYITLGLSSPLIGHVEKAFNQIVEEYNA